MTDANVNKKSIYIRWFLLRFGLVMFDILAVNLAYYMALVVRFYVHDEFAGLAARYIPAFLEFAPYYTVCALVVFGLFGLYNSLWKYASLSDMNRILGASAVTCVLYVLGTLFFVMRMPITYYALGAAFQFVLITGSRFSYRLLTMERERFSLVKRHDVVKLLVVGLGESSRTVIKHLEQDPDSMAKPVCVIDVGNTAFKGTMVGVPVMGGADKIPHAIQKYRVDRVLVADTLVSAEERRAIKEMCRKLDVPVQDFSGYFQSAPTRIPLKFLLEYVEGPVVIENGDQQTRYATANQAIASISGKYIVASVYTLEDAVCIRLIQDVLRSNDTQAEWVEAYQKETGEGISFF